MSWKESETFTHEPWVPWLPTSNPNLLQCLAEPPAVGALLSHSLQPVWKKHSQPHQRTSRRQSLQLTMARPGCQGGSQAQLDSSASLLCKNTHTQAHTHTEAYSLHSWPLGPRASPTVHVLGLAHPRLSEVPPSSAHSQPLHHLLPPKAFLKGSGN